MDVFSSNDIGWSVKNKVVIAKNGTKGQYYLPCPTLR